MVRLRLSLLDEFLFLLFAAPTFVACFKRRPCTRKVQADFQFSDCFLPKQNAELLLSEASFLLSHDAGTGYIKANSLSTAGLSWWYAKNQVGTAYDQLQNGARALDLRLKLLLNGTIVLHHGEVQLPVSYATLLQDALKWCQENPSELVLLIPSHFSYETSRNASNDSSSTSMSDALNNLYQTLGIPYVHCSEVYGLTVGETQALAQLADSGGLLLALDGQDYYGTPCAKQNYVEELLVTCWDNTTSCKTSSDPWKALQSYILQSVNNEPTDDNSLLGPPASLEQTPLYEIQALWQVDTHAVTAGLAHGSSLLEDNRASQINARLVHLIHQGTVFSQPLSLLAVDQVALHGNALLSVLRTACDQQTDLSVLDDDDSLGGGDLCGPQLAPPPLNYPHVTRLQWILALTTAYVLLVWVVGTRYRKILRTWWSRLAMAREYSADSPISS